MTMRNLEMREWVRNERLRCTWQPRTVPRKRESTLTKQSSSALRPLHCQAKEVSKTKELRSHARACCRFCQVLISYLCLEYDMVLQNSGKYRPDKSSSTSEKPAGYTILPIFRNSFFTHIYRGKEDVSESRIARVHESNAIDEKYGFSSSKESGEKVGYLINMHSV